MQGIDKRYHVYREYYNETRKSWEGERERGSKEKKGQDRLGRAEPPNVRGDRPDAPCTTVDEHDVKIKNKYGQGTGGGKDGWRQRQLAGCQESWSKKGVEDRHEALSIFFDMKVTVRGSGEEEGLE